MSGWAVVQARQMSRRPFVRVTIVQVPTKGLGAADKWMMVTILAGRPDISSPRQKVPGLLLEHLFFFF